MKKSWSWYQIWWKITITITTWYQIYGRGKPPWRLVVVVGGVQSHFHVKPCLGHVRLSWFLTASVFHFSWRGLCQYSWGAGSTWPSPPGRGGSGRRCRRPARQGFPFSPSPGAPRTRSPAPTQGCTCWWLLCQVLPWRIRRQTCRHRLLHSGTLRSICNTVYNICKLFSVQPPLTSQTKSTKKYR